MTVYGRKTLFDRIDTLHQSAQHVSVVGARAIGKTVLLQSVVAKHAAGAGIFVGAGIVDLRHDPPTTTEAALRRVAIALRDVFRSAPGGGLNAFADEVHPDDPAEDVFDQLKIALDMIAEAGQRILLVLDGCDPVLQNSAIPRNLWDNLRALAQIKSLRLMTSSRDQLHRLCYNPDARTSDFFRIFYDEPLVVGPLDSADWTDVSARCGLSLDGAALKEMINWTGGHPDLVDLLLGRLREAAKGSATNEDVNEVAQALLTKAGGRLHSLWMDCPDDVRSDIVQLCRGEVSAAEIKPERVRYLTERGIASESGRKVRLINRFIEKLAGERKAEVTGARRLFESPEDFTANIRTVLDLRVGQIKGADAKLLQYVRRAIGHIPAEPEAALGCARDILDRALNIVWDTEAPDGKVPNAWIEHWKHSGLTREIDEYRNGPIPEARGRQCGLLRTATGKQFVKAATRKITKGTYAFIEHMNHMGDLKNHAPPNTEMTLGAAIAFCFGAVELLESISRDLQR